MVFVVVAGSKTTSPMFKPSIQLVLLFLIFDINSLMFAVIIEQALICDNSIGHSNYVVPNVKPCEYTLTEKSSSCQANIFNVNLARIPLRAYFCTKKTEKFTSTMFFWGDTSFTKDSTSYQPLLFQVCTRMFRNKVHPTLGLLYQSTPQLWNTNRKYTPKYVWLRTLQSTLTNVYLKETQVYYNVITRKIITNLENTDQCKFEDGFCTTPTKIIVWQTNSTDICQFLNIAKIHESDAKLHFTKDYILTRIDLPKIASSFSQFRDIDKHIVGCFTNPKEKILQTQEGLILQLQGCSKKIKKFSHLKEKFMIAKWGNISDPNIPTKVSAEFNYLFDIQRNTMIRMESEINFLECKQDNLIRKHTKLLSRLYPSHMLSEILGRPVGATVTNDVLTEKSCSSHNLTLQPTLWLNDKTFSTKPLANLTLTNASVTVQLLEENIWSTEIVFLTNTAVTGYLSFSIGGHIVSYLNGTLLQSPVKVTPIGIKPPTFDLKYENEDFTLSGILSNKPLQSDSMLAMEMALKTLQFDQQMNQYQPGKQLWRNFRLTDTKKTPHKIFHNIQGSTFFRGISSILNFLSQIWGTILTTFAIYIVVQTCCGKSKKKHMKPRMESPTQIPRPIVIRNNNVKTKNDSRIQTTQL